jgi:lysyl-tRNA synthetase class II
MTQETDQLIQRRENLAELVRLGIDPYPHRFDRTDTIEALVGQHGQKSRDPLLR